MTAGFKPIPAHTRIEYGDVVMIWNMKKQVQYNGKIGVVSRFDKTGEPIVKLFRPDEADVPLLKILRPKDCLILLSRDAKDNDD